MAIGNLPVSISYSGGTSSEWLVEAVARGVLEVPEHYAVFFADTGAEHLWTYRAVDEVEARCRERGVEFVRCRAPGETLLEHVVCAIADARSRMSSPPFWTRDLGGKKGRLAQECTQEWKTRPLRRAVSAWLKRIGAKKRVVTWIGFAADELSRAVKAESKRDVLWETLDFPAVRLGVTRDQQRADLTRWTGRAPEFSMCTFCPYKTPGRWLRTSGRDMEMAQLVEDAIRHVPDTMSIDDDLFLSDRLKPIAEVIAEARARADHGEAIDPPGCDAGRCFL